METPLLSLLLLLLFDMTVLFSCNAVTGCSSKVPIELNVVYWKEEEKVVALTCGRRRRRNGRGRKMDADDGGHPSLVHHHRVVFVLWQRSAASLCDFREVKAPSLKYWSIESNRVESNTSK